MAHSASTDAVTATGGGASAAASLEDLQADDEFDEFATERTCLVCACFETHRYPRWFV